MTDRSYVMESQHTCLEIQLLMHVFYSPLPIPSAGFPAQREALRSFISSGVMVEVKRFSGYELTELGYRWLGDVLNVPIPSTTYMPFLPEEIPK